MKLTRLIVIVAATLAFGAAVLAEGLKARAGDVEFKVPKGFKVKEGFEAKDGLFTSDDGELNLYIGSDADKGYDQWLKDMKADKDVEVHEGKKVGGHEAFEMSSMKLVDDVGQYSRGFVLKTKPTGVISISGTSGWKQLADRTLDALIKSAGGGSKREGGKGK